MNKSADAFRTISEVADWLDTPTHVLRFWESKFSQIKPVKRAGGRRYYRPQDMLLIGGIKKLLHYDGLTIKGAQRVIQKQGQRYVCSLSQPLQSQSSKKQDAATKPSETSKKNSDNLKADWKPMNISKNYKDLEAVLDRNDDSLSNMSLPGRHLHKQDYSSAKLNPLIVESKNKKFETSFTATDDKTFEKHTTKNKRNEKGTFTSKPKQLNQVKPPSNNKENKKFDPSFSHNQSTLDFWENEDPNDNYVDYKEETFNASISTIDVQLEEIQDISADQINDLRPLILELKKAIDKRRRGLARGKA